MSLSPLDAPSSCCALRSLAPASACLPPNLCPASDDSPLAAALSAALCLANSPSALCCACPNPLDRKAPISFARPLPNASALSPAASFALEPKADSPADAMSLALCAISPFVACSVISSIVCCTTLSSNGSKNCCVMRGSKPRVLALVKSAASLIPVSKPPIPRISVPSALPSPLRCAPVPNEANSSDLAKSRSKLSPAIALMPNASVTSLPNSSNVRLPCCLARAKSIPN